MRATSFANPREYDVHDHNHGNKLDWVDQLVQGFGLQVAGEQKNAQASTITVANQAISRSFIGSKPSKIRVPSLRWPSLQ
jgi:hypothetical protein